MAQDSINDIGFWYLIVAKIFNTSLRHRFRDSVDKKLQTSAPIFGSRFLDSFKRKLKALVPRFNGVGFWYQFLT